MTGMHIGPYRSSHWNFMGFFTLRNPLKAPKFVMILMMVMIIIIFIPGFLKTGLEKNVNLFCFLTI